MQQGVPLGPLVPLFTFAKTRLQADILATPLEQYSDTYMGYDPPWESKSQNKLLWRGVSLSSRRAPTPLTRFLSFLSQERPRESSSTSTLPGASPSVLDSIS